MFFVGKNKYNEKIIETDSEDAEMEFQFEEQLLDSEFQLRTAQSVK